MRKRKLAAARRMYDSGRHTVNAIAETVGVSRATIYRRLAPTPAEAKPMEDHEDVVAGASVAVAEQAVRKKPRGR